MPCWKIEIDAGVTVEKLTGAVNVISIGRLTSHTCPSAGNTDSTMKSPGCADELSLKSDDPPLPHPAVSTQAAAAAPRERTPAILAIAKSCFAKPGEDESQRSKRMV